MQFAIQTMTSYRPTLELALWAESADLAGFAVADHYVTSGDNFYALDQLAVLAAVAAHTQRIELSTLVSPVTFRHPAVMLKNAVTIDEISSGRFTLGVGAGWMQDEHDRFGLDFPTLGERFERMTEAIQYLRAGFAGEGFSGNHYELSPGALPHGEGVKLVVGGAGARRTPELAGRYADEFNPFPSKAPYQPRIDAARRAAAEAGRDPDSLLISTAFPLVVGADASEADEKIAEVAERRGTSAAEIRERWGSMGIPIGGVDEYHRQLAGLAELGIQRVYFQVAFDPIEEIKRSVELLTR